MSRRSFKVIITTLSYAFLASGAQAAAEAPTSAASKGAKAESATQSADGTASLAEAVARLSHFQGRSQPLQRSAELVLSQDAQVRVAHTSMLPVGPRGAKVPVETVIVQSGRADATLKRGPSRGVLLQSKDQVQAIATNGRVAFIAKDGMVAVAALEGTALVGQKGLFKPLSEGRVRVFSLTTGGTTDAQVPTAPTIKSSGLPVTLQGGAEIPLIASPVVGAASYRAYILDQQGAVVAEKTSSDPTALSMLVPKAGNYFAVTQAVDQNGFEGRPSSPLPVRVLGLENANEVVRDGFIYLGPGEAARFAGQEGLLMRYGASTDFVPAPSYVGLPTRKATTLEFRDPKDSRISVVFKLAPRVLKSKIAISPRTGSWPDHDLRLSVRMWDGQGVSETWMDEYKVVVKVGLVEVPVDWNRNEGYLNATLAPQPGPGPWVVRVSVQDQAGEEVARNFLEVAHSRQAKAKSSSAEVASTAP